jgi:hypothetical protein
MAEALYVCRMGDGPTDEGDYVQAGTFGSLTLAKWGPLETALAQPKSWWKANVTKHALSYCDLVQVERADEEPQTSDDRPTSWERLLGDD